MSKKAASAHPAKFCRIIDYVKTRDEDFADVFRHLCLEGALTPGHHRGGVTLLYPVDKEHRKEIYDKALVKGDDEVIKMVEALIIPTVLTSGADFKKTPIGSHGGVLYEVISASGNKAKLKGEKGDVELELDTEFKTFARHDGEQKTAVWKITSGRPPTTGAEFTRQARRHHGPETKRAENKEVLGGRPDARAGLAAKTEEEYCKARRERRADNPYLGKVVGLLNYLNAKHPSLLPPLLPILDYDPIISFYLLLEPYKTSGKDFLIPHNILFGPDAWEGVEAYTDAVSEYKSYFASIAKNAGDAKALCFHDWNKVVQAIEMTRQNILTHSQAKNKIVAAVKSIYEKLVTDNKIGGVGPILPEATRKLLTPQKKLWQDEARILIHALVWEMNSEPVFDEKDFEKIVDFVKHSHPGDNYEKEWGPFIRGNVAPTADYHAFVKFINSTDFLFIALSEDAISKKIGGSLDSPDDQTVFNRNRAAIQGLTKAASMVRASGVSPQALTELAVYAQRTGALPPEVTSIISAVKKA